MDISTLIGLIAGILILVRAVWCDPGAVYHGLSLLVVLGGGIAASLVAFRLGDIVRVLGGARSALLSRRYSHTALLEQIVGFAETARREGILALEPAAKEVGDLYLASGLRLAVDGTEPGLIRSILDIELTYIDDRHRQGQRLFSVLERSWITFGAIGALLVLVFNSVTAESGVALVSLASVPMLYGLLLTGLLAHPFRLKLEARAEEESIAKEMIMEGISSIQAGDNPRIIEQKLNVFLAPKLRAVKKSPPKVKPAASEQEGKSEIELPEPDTDLLLAGEVIDRLKGALSTSEERIPEPPQLDELLALLDPQGRSEILEMLDEKPPVPASQAAAFRFEDITRLTDREIQMILRETDLHDLVLAMKGSSQELQQRFLANVSHRVSTMITEEMAARKRVKLRNVVNVQLRIIRAVQLLAEHGQVTIPPNAE